MELSKGTGLTSQARQKKSCFGGRGFESHAGLKLNYHGFKSEQDQSVSRSDFLEGVFSEYLNYLLKGSYFDFLMFLLSAICFPSVKRPPLDFSPLWLFFFRIRFCDVFS